MSTKLSFSLALKEIPGIELTGTDNVTRTYTLRELTGAQRDVYLDEMGKRMKFEKGKPAGLSSFAGMQSLLLSLSLYDTNGKAVSKAEIEAWPSGVQTALYEESQKLSGLNKEDKGKNDQPESA